MPADNASGSMSVLDALKGVLKISLIHDGLARGLREASKALDRRQALLEVLDQPCRLSAPGGRRWLLYLRSSWEPRNYLSLWEYEVN